jgi:hypothetical protein
MQVKEKGVHTLGQRVQQNQTFSETRLLLPFNNSGAIQGSVPLTPPEISVWHLTFDNPKSPTYKNRKVILMSKHNQEYQRCLRACMLFC